MNRLEPLGQAAGAHEDVETVRQIAEVTAKLLLGLLADRLFGGEIVVEPGADLDQKARAALEMGRQAELADEQDGAAIGVDRQDGGAVAVVVDLADQGLAASVAAGIGDGVAGEPAPAGRQDLLGQDAAPATVRS